MLYESFRTIELSDYRAVELAIGSPIFTCVAKGESRSRSLVTPSVCSSVHPKILSSQLLWNYWSNYHETWYVDRTSYVVMHITKNHKKGLVVLYLINSAIIFLRSFNWAFFSEGQLQTYNKVMLHCPSEYNTRVEITQEQIDGVHFV